LAGPPRSIMKPMDTFAVFDEHRPYLFGIAYRMLGSVMDAEDVVQDAYLRWEQADRPAIANPRAYLSTIVTRLSIDALRAAQRRRETYIGEWLPEPLVTADGPDATAERAESLSTAFLVLLERLSPQQRAAFLLRDVFGYAYAEMAAMLDTSEPNCRQLVKRARGHMAAGKRRFDSDRAEHQRLLHEFVAAMQTRDYRGLVTLLAEDATFHSDHGGKAAAARRVIRSADKIARFLLGIQERFQPDDFSVRIAALNGRPGIISYAGATPEAAFTFDTDGGRISTIYAVRNPDKLAPLPRLK